MTARALFLSWVVIATLSFCGASAADAPPNVILFMADDLGYSDLGCYGSDVNPTPNLDRMAAAGIRFTDFQTSSWCEPSRRALMTGCDAHRPGLMGRDRVLRVLAERVTIAEMLREHGYATSLIGKWHLGLEKGVNPMDQGFDYWYGTEGSNDWHGPHPNYDAFRNAPAEAWKTPMYENGEDLGVCPQTEFTKRYTEQTVRLIREQKDRPFFIFLSQNMPHVPVFPSERFAGTSKNGRYGDVVAELDWSMGEVLKALEEEGVAENTLVLFTSDNGPWRMYQEWAGVTGPLQGQKATTWEGGGRVPMIAFWPGKIRPAVSDSFFFMTDLYATLANLAGAEIAAGEALDSLDVTETLLTGAPSPRASMIYYYKKDVMAYRRGDYKLHFMTRERVGDPFTRREEPSTPRDPPLLFNVAEDPGETTDLAADHPEIVRELTEESADARRAIESWERYDWAG